MIIPCSHFTTCNAPRLRFSLQCLTEINGTVPRPAQATKLMSASAVLPPTPYMNARLANLGPGSPIFANTGAPTLRQPDRSPDGKYFRQAIDPQPQRLIWSFRPSSSLRLSSLYYDSAIVGGGVDNSWLRPSCNQRNHGECDHKFFLLHQSFTENRPFSTHCGRLVCARALSLFRDVIPIRRCHKMTSPPRELDAM